MASFNLGFRAIYQNQATFECVGKGGHHRYLVELCIIVVDSLSYAYQTFGR